MIAAQATSLLLRCPWRRSTAGTRARTTACTPPPRRAYLSPLRAQRPRPHQRYRCETCGPLGRQLPPPTAQCWLLALCSKVSSVFRALQRTTKVSSSTLRLKYFTYKFLRLQCGQLQQQPAAIAVSAISRRPPPCRCRWRARSRTLSSPPHLTALALLQLQRHFCHCRRGRCTHRRTLRPVCNRRRSGTRRRRRI